MNFGRVPGRALEPGMTVVPRGGNLWTLICLDPDPSIVLRHTVTWYGWSWNEGMGRSAVFYVNQTFKVLG